MILAFGALKTLHRLQYTILSIESTLLTVNLLGSRAYRFLKFFNLFKAIVDSTFLNELLRASCILLESLSFYSLCKLQRLKRKQANKKFVIGIS